ncbi:Hypothetical predicted protein [Mytilus galloprovincialis]|uniref:Uncharacterized protein n=1 Tax=Mytilus galloprovincialis TaxID=29158 RepID=A0A8B6HEW0_MYTGA|nr:Hypothetical predicted protein [Mytilus galloprovincialis]
MMRTLSLFLLFLTIDGGYCCSCYPNHSQTAFCGSEVVIRGKAINRYRSPLKDLPINNEAFPGMFDNVIYGVEVIEVFKIDPWQGLTKKIDTCYYMDEFPGYDTTCLWKFGRCSQGESGACNWDVEQNNSCRNSTRN